MKKRTKSALMGLRTEGKVDVMACVIPNGGQPPLPAISLPLNLACFSKTSKAFVLLFAAVSSQLDESIHPHSLLRLEVNSHGKRKKRRSA